MPRGVPRKLSELKKGAAKSLATFTDPKGHYAFKTYDQAPVHDGPLTAADVLMANLLSLRLSGLQVIPLFADEETPHTRLRLALDDALEECRQFPDLEQCSDEQLKMPALASANALADDVDDWTNVTVSKVLHRLAPTVPLIDSYIRGFFHTTQPYKIRRLLRDELQANAAWLRSLLPINTREALGGHCRWRGSLTSSFG